MTNKTKISPDFSKMKKPEIIPEHKKISYKRRFYSGLAGKVLLEQSIGIESKNNIIGDVINGVFYKGGLITKISENVDGVTIEFDGNHSERVIFLINIGEHAIDINELLKLEGQEVGVFRKKGKEGKDGNIISIKGIVVRK